jgi:hypothetical protein
MQFDVDWRTPEFHTRIEQAKQTLLETATVLARVASLSANEDETAPPPDCVVLAYHKYRVAADRFDRLCRSYVDELS